MSGMKPLEGLRVVGTTHIAAGPFCLSLLGDMGADVINVEPLSGENMRQRDHAFGSADSAYFHGVNRSKRSVCIDLKSPEGRTVFERLVRSADVFVHNYRLQAVRSLRLDYPTLRAFQPRLVYCGITAWGSAGPKAEDPGMDLLIQAFSGLMSLNSEPGRLPVRIPASLSDLSAAYLAAFGIMLALWVRERTGQGQEVEVSLLGAITATMANLIPLHFRTGGPEPMGSAHPQIVPYQAFRTRDGSLVYIACLTQQFWVHLCQALGREDLQADPRFASPAARLEHREELLAILAPLVGTYERAELLERLQAHDVPAEPIHSLREAFSHPQAAASGLIATLDHPVAGTVHVAANPVRLQGTPGAISRPAPLLGEHTREVLLELGFSPSYIDGLFARGLARESRPGREPAT